MMRKVVTKAKISVRNELKCEALELPYVGEEVTMMFILPND
mgnify:CR=1 FL=1